MPSKASSAGQIHCCDNADIKETLNSAMEDLDRIKLHIMSWPNKTLSNPPRAVGAAAALRPPNWYCFTILSDNIQVDKRRN